MSFAAFVITFDRPAILGSTLTKLLAQSQPPDRILVIDNRPSAESRDAAESADRTKIHYAPMETNVGPAGAAAFGLQELTQQGYDWIYWGDDDDPPRTPDTFARLLHLAQNGGDDVGAVGAVGSRWNWSRGRTVRLTDEQLEGVIEVDVIAGSSQFILSGPAVRSTGLPEARLFFGFEEPSYCLRLRRDGFRLLVDGSLHLEYRRSASRLNLDTSRPWRPRHDRHEIWRQYYSTRNYIYTMREYFDRPDLARREALRAAARMATSWGQGPRYGSHFTKLQCRGLRDGYAANLGLTIRPEQKDGS